MGSKFSFLKKSFIMFVLTTTTMASEAKANTAFENEIDWTAQYKKYPVLGHCYISCHNDGASVEINSELVSKDESQALPRVYLKNLTIEVYQKKTDETQWALEIQNRSAKDDYISCKATYESENHTEMLIDEKVVYEDSEREKVAFTIPASILKQHREHGGSALRFRCLSHRRFAAGLVLGVFGLN